MALTDVTSAVHPGLRGTPPGQAAPLWGAGTVPRAVVVIIVLISSTTFSILNRQYTLDDALIYYRYLQNALDGHGLVYNAGEYVNGLTSPLYTYLSLACAFVIRDVAFSQQVLGWLLITGASVAVMYLRPESNGTAPGSAFAALGIVSMRYVYSVIGLETPLLIFLLVLVLALFLRARTGAWMFVSALLLLTRGESVFLVLVLIAAHLLLRRPFPGWRLWALPATVLVVHYAFTTAYFGSPFPATLMAKVQQGESGLWETGRWGKHLIFLSVGYQFDRYFGGSLVLLSGPVFLAAGGVLARRREILTQIIVVFLLLYTAFYIVLSIPNYHWYYAAYYVFMYILAGECIGAWSTRAMHLPSRAWRRISGAGLILLAVGIVAGQAHFAVRELPWAGGYGSYTEIALWIKEHTPREAKVAAAEIGHIGWFSDRYIIDILGLVSPPNAELIGQRKFGAWLQYYSPDYILVHDPLWRQETGVEGLLSRGTFADVAGFAFPGYRLLAPAGAHPPAHAPNAPGGTP